MCKKCSVSRIEGKFEEWWLVGKYVHTWQLHSFQLHSKRGHLLGKNQVAGNIIGLQLKPLNL